MYQDKSDICEDADVHIAAKGITKTKKKQLRKIIYTIILD